MGKTIFLFAMPLLLLIFSGNKRMGENYLLNKDEQVFEKIIIVNEEEGKPYYMLGFSASACYFEILLNNVPLFSMNVKGQVATKFPINNLILESGTQVLSVKVTPCLEEVQFHNRSSFSTRILLYDVSDGFKLISEEQEHAMPLVTDNTLSLYTDITTFEANVPYKLDAWQNSKNLYEIENLKSLILDEYKKIISLIENKDYDAFKAILAQREQNTAISMYLDKEESEHTLDDFIKELEQGYKPIPFTGTETLHLYADGKVAVLKLPDGDTALRFEHEEKDELISLEIFFHIPDGTLKVI